MTTERNQKPRSTSPTTSPASTARSSNVGAALRRAGCEESP